jgi:hypothetical protein
MVCLAPVLMLLFPLSAGAADSPAVDTRLARLIEAAVSVTGLSINISGSTRTTLTIDRINGVEVCSAQASHWARDLQDALNRQPHVRDVFGPAYFSVTDRSGVRKYLTAQEIRARGLISGCTSIYVSIHAD